MKIKEHACIALMNDLPAERLKAGDIGTAMHFHNGGEGCEVEFMTQNGATVALVTLLAGQIRVFKPRELASARELAAS